MTSIQRLVSRVESRIDMVTRIIGKEYLTKHVGIEENTSDIEEIYREIVKVTNELFKRIPYDVVFVDEEPYQSCNQMKSEVYETGILYIFKGGSDHPHYSHLENWKGRAVHDWFHIIGEHPFSFLGELKAYEDQKLFYPEYCWSVLFAEIPAQTAAYVVNGKSHDFPQRAIKAPLDWMQLAEMIL